MMLLMNELKKEKKFREQECKKHFRQWHENISLHCTLVSSHKLPLCSMKDDGVNKSKHTTTSVSGVSDDSEDKHCTLNVVSRMRDKNKFMETESPFAAFQLQNEFTNEYEMYMQGSVKEIREQLDLLNQRMEQYLDRFPDRAQPSPFRFPHGNQSKQTEPMTTKN